MVEQILFFVLGFLAASLGALAFLRAVWSRAVRLTTLRVVSRLPVSPAMIAADRDRLRAAHAIDIRRLERRIDQLNEARPANEAISTQDKAAIRRLSIELAEARRKLGQAEMERRAAAPAAEPAASPLRETIWAGSRRVLGLARAGVQQLPRPAGEPDPAKVAALEAEVHSLLTIVGNLESELAQRQEAASAPDGLAPQTRVSADPSAGAATRTDAENRELVSALAQQTVDLEQKLAAEQANTDSYREQVGALQAELSARDETLAQEARRKADLEAAVAAAKAREAQQQTEIERLRGERETTAAELAATLDMLRAERAGFEVNVDGVRAERAKLQQRVAELEQQIARKSAEQDDSRYLREKLESLAEEIVRAAGGELPVAEAPDAPALAAVEPAAALESAAAEEAPQPRRAIS